MLNLPAELRSIVLSYVPIADIAPLFKIPAMLLSVSREINRRPAQMLIMCHFKNGINYIEHRLEGITHIYGLYAFNANKGLLYYFRYSLYVDVSHLYIADIIYCHAKAEEEEIVYDILYLTSTQDFCLARGRNDRVTEINLLWRNVTRACLAWSHDSAALLCKGEVYLTDNIFDDEAYFNKLPCVIEAPPREMQLWTVGSSQYLAVLDQEHTLRIYPVVGSVPIDIIPDVATLLSGKKTGGYIDLNDGVFTWKRNEKRRNFDEINLFPYLNTHLMYYHGVRTATCTYSPSTGIENKEDIEFRVIFDPVVPDEEICY